MPDDKKQDQGQQSNQTNTSDSKQSQADTQNVQRGNLFGPGDENVKTFSDTPLRKQRTEKE